MADETLQIRRVLLPVNHDPVFVIRSLACSV